MGPNLGKLLLCSRLIKPDLEVVAAGADTERVPFAFLEQGGDALATPSLRIDIALGAGVKAAGHVDSTTFD